MSWFMALLIFLVSALCYGAEHYASAVVTALVSGYFVGIAVAIEFMDAM